MPKSPLGKAGIAFDFPQKPHMKLTNLTEHPEGGRFKEVFRSSAQVTNSKGENKAALTHIYFSLNSGELSKWHKVSSDEIWNLYQGKLLLHLWDGTDNRPQSIELSKETKEFCHVVPAGWWQAAWPLTDSVVVGCSVAPGFEFADFQLIDSNSTTANKIVSLAPDMKKFL